MHERTDICLRVRQVRVFEIICFMIVNAGNISILTALCFPASNIECQCVKQLKSPACRSKSCLLKGQPCMVTDARVGVVSVCLAHVRDALVKQEMCDP